MLPGFFFDDTARASSQDELLDQLPDRLAVHSSGIAFQDLFTVLANEVPVTQEIMARVLADLSRDGVIQVRDRTGLTRRRAGIQRKSDIIVRSSQRLIDF